MIDLFDRAFADDPKYGGTQIMTYGAKGSGKSLLLSTWAIKDLQHGHRVVWRSKDVDSWTIFANRVPVNVIIPDKLYAFEVERQGKKIALPDNVSISVIPRPDDAAHNLMQGAINVICLEATPASEAAWWTVFCDRLVHLPTRWTSLFFDEINDVFVSKPTGDQWMLQDRFKNVFASFRKKKIHFRGSAHIFHDVDYNISYKFKYTVYLQGAILLPKKRTRLRTPSLISQLNDFQGILDDSSSFVVFDYDPLPGDIATSDVVSFEGPEWSLNDYPNISLQLGIRPVIKCQNPECNRPIRVWVGQTSCPYCGTDIWLVDKNAPVGQEEGEGGISIDQKEGHHMGQNEGCPVGTTIDLSTEIHEVIPQETNNEAQSSDLDDITALDGSCESNWKVGPRKFSRKRSKTMPELVEQSKNLRHEAALKHECANCGKKLGGSRVYYCSDNCMLEFYNSHPTSISWNDVRKRALERDQNTCVKCGKAAEEVDHVKEIWEGGPEFDLDNLQSLCHDCHVAKTNESRRKGDEQADNKTEA